MNIEKIMNTFNEVTYNETYAIHNGAKQLNGLELEELIKNKEVNGDYPGGFVFVARIYENGKTEGINQYGHYDEGNWKIDFKHNLIHLQWENGWINTITRAYLIENSIVFFDEVTGKWRTTFKTIGEIK